MFLGSSWLSLPAPQPSEMEHSPKNHMSSSEPILDLKTDTTEALPGEKYASLLSRVPAATPCRAMHWLSWWTCAWQQALNRDECPCQPHVMVSLFSCCIPFPHPKWPDLLPIPVMPVPSWAQAWDQRHIGLHSGWGGHPRWENCLLRGRWHKKGCLFRRSCGWVCTANKAFFHQLGR